MKREVEEYPISFEDLDPYELSVFHYPYENHAMESNVHHNVHTRSSYSHEFAMSHSPSTEMMMHGNMHLKQKVASLPEHPNLPMNIESGISKNLGMVEPRRAASPMMHFSQIPQNPGLINRLSFESNHPEEILKFKPKNITNMGHTPQRPDVMDNTITFKPSDIAIPSYNIVSKSSLSKSEEGSPPYAEPVMNNSIFDRVRKNDDIEKLRNDTYSMQIHQISETFNTIRSNIAKGEDINGVLNQIVRVRDALQQMLSELNNLCSTCFLTANEFQEFERFTSMISYTLVPQLNLYENDCERILYKSNEVPIYLSIVSQKEAGPIKYKSTIGEISVKALTGAMTTIVSGSVQPTLVGKTNARKKKDGGFEKYDRPLNKDGTASFSDLQFVSGTYPNLVNLKFKGSLMAYIEGQKVTIQISSPPSKQFISMTNTGSQWLESSRKWLKIECFGENPTISMQRLWNFFYKFFLVATKQDVHNIQRPLLKRDFVYMLEAQNIYDLQSINEQQFDKFWSWIGPSLKKIRYQQQVIWLFKSGYFPAFVTRPEAEKELKKYGPGAFLIRLGREPGSFIISYNVGDSGEVHHYIMQQDDTADKKKTIVDFIMNEPTFKSTLKQNFDASFEESWEIIAKEDAFKTKFKQKKTKRKSRVPTGYENHIIRGREDFH